MELFARPNTALLALALAMPLAACGQNGFGPLDPTPPSGITVDQIIQKFGEREAQFKQARDSYIFRQSVKIDIINDDSGKVDGEYYQVSDVTFNDAGQREEHVVYAPESTLDASATPVERTPADVDEVEHRLPFILTTDDLPHYDIRYLGKQKVDELNTYVFEAGPKVLEKNKKYFQGKVWVDQRDLQIVLINGQTVPQDTRPGHEDLQPPFTTYYEQVDGKYWFPTYTKAEGELHFAASKDGLGEDVHMRSVVRYTDYKQFHANVRIIYDGQDITNQKPDEGSSGQPQTQTPPAQPK